MNWVENISFLPLWVAFFPGWKMCSKALKFLSGSKVLATGRFVLWNTEACADAWAESPNCFKRLSSLALNCWLYVGRSFGGSNPVGGAWRGLTLISFCGNSSDAGRDVGSSSFWLICDGRKWLDACVSKSSYFLSAFFDGAMIVFWGARNLFCGERFVKVFIESRNPRL